jgi:hypothetical protein
MICTLHPTLYECSNRGEKIGGACSTYGERRGVYRVLVDKSEGNPVVDGRITLRWIFRKWDMGVWTGSMWLRIGTGGGHL